MLVVAFLFFLVRMPEPTRGSKIVFSWKIFKHRHLTLAVLAQFLYVGAQVGIWGITLNYVTTLIPGMTNESASKYYMAVGTALFVIGRVLGTMLLGKMKGNRILTIYGIAAALLCLVGVFGKGEIAVYAVLGTNFFMSIMFPTIFALGVKNLDEEETKVGSSFIIMSIVGGAVIPPLMGMFANIQNAFIIPCVCFLAVLYYGWSGYKAKSA